MFFFEYPEWINFDFGNWTIKDDAPDYVKKEFERMKKQYDEAQEKGDVVE